MKNLFYTIFLFSMIALSCSESEDPAVTEDQLEENVLKLADYCNTKDTKALLVMREGQVIHESYYNGYQSSDVNLLASGTKSFSGVIAAAAVHDGLINYDDLASDYIDSWKADPLKKLITLRQLLNQSSGLNPGDASSATEMPSWADIINEPLIDNPGQRFRYGPYHFNAFAYALEQQLMAINEETLEDYFNRRILAPLGIEVFWLYRCADGKPQMGGGAAMTAPDWLTFGEFILNEGTFQGQEIIRKEILNELLQPSPQNPAYGLGWWLSENVSDQLTAQNAPVKQIQPLVNASWAPDDLFFAAGAGKQRLYIFPEEKLVVVRQGKAGIGFEDEDAVSLLIRGVKANE